MHQRAVSISIGSIKRDKTVEIKLFGKTISLERIGTDGDMKAASDLYRKLDGKVGALGVGGAVLGLLVDKDWYDFHSILPLVKDVKKTPLVDGTGLKSKLESKAAEVIAPYLNGQPKRVLQMSAVDRYGLSQGFVECGFESVFGDLMFGLGLPLPIRSERVLKRIARLLMPVVSRMPFGWLYPSGEKQDIRTPKYVEYFQWASVISGDCHYITKYMPDDLSGKIIVTNTTTEEDREMFKKAGARLLVTTTPVLDGRTFGTNLIEAGIITARGWQEAVDYRSADYYQKMEAAVEELGLTPQVTEL